MTDRTEASPLNADLSRKQAVVILTIIVALAALLRVYDLGDQNYWLDETYTLISSSGHYDEFAALPCNQLIHGLPTLTELGDQSSILEIWNSQLHDVHPPLYFMMMSAVRRIAGDSEFAVRLPSAFASIATLCLLYLLFRAFSSRWASIFGVLVCTVAFSSISLAQEARPYSLSLCLAVATAVLLTQIELRTRVSGSPTQHWMYSLYVLISTAALMTDHRLLMLVPVRAAFAWFSIRGSSRNRILVAEFAAMAIYAILFGGWFLMGQSWRTDVNWLTEQSEGHWLDTAIRFLGVPVRLMLGAEWAKSTFIQVFGGIAFLATTIWVLSRQRNSRQLFLLFWFLVPLVVFCFVDLFRDSGTLGHTRFLLIALPGLAGLLAISWDVWPSFYYRIPAAIVVASCLLTFSYPTRVNPEAQIAAEYIKANLDDGTLLVFDGRKAPTWWAKTLLGRVANYHNREIDNLILLCDPLDQKAQSVMQQFDSLVVLRGRTDKPDVALYPGYSLQASSPPFRGIGTIDLLRQESASATVTSRPLAEPTGRSSLD